MSIDRGMAIQFMRRIQNGIPVGLKNKGDSDTYYILHTTYILKNSNLSESSQSQNDRYCMIPFIQIPRAGKFTETERQI